MTGGRMIRGVAPMFLVRDVIAANSYYADKLGFVSPRMWGDPPTFCIPQRDGIEVMLNQVQDGAEVRPNGASDGWDAYFWVNDADALFAEFEGKGADVVCEPEDQVYEMREFSVRDLDGYLLAFGHNTGGTA